MAGGKSAKPEEAMVYPAYQDEDEESVADTGERDQLDEKASVLARKLPPLSSRQEIEEHEIDYYFYRSWCRSYVTNSVRRYYHLLKSNAVDDDHVSIILVMTSFTLPKRSIYI